MMKREPFSLEYLYYFGGAFSAGLIGQFLQMSLDTAVASRVTAKRLGQLIRDSE